PTRTALQICLASLEGAEHGVAFSSGLGAATTLMHLLNPGDRVVAVADVYGGIYRMFSQVYGPKGYEFEWVPAEELDANPAGCLATNDPTIAERLYFLQKSLGAIPGPMDAWLVLRGLKTLAVRMRQHCRNAEAIAAHLEHNPRVEGVLYPGLPSHPGHGIAA